MSVNEESEFWREVRRDKQAEHANRVAAAMAALLRAHEFCAERGIVLKVHANGVHWQFVKENRVINWWPGTRRMHCNYIGGAKWPNDIEGALAIVGEAM